VSTAAPSHPALAGGPPPGATPADACPLCGTPLQPAQEWCLKCGAAARTRLAAAPNWRAPIVTAAVIAALAVGVLAAAVVKLAADTGPAPAASTQTVTTAATATPLATVPSSAATVPTAPTTTSSATTTGSAGAAGAGGAAAPAGGASATSPNGSPRTTPLTGTAPTSTGGVKKGERILPTTIPRVVPSNPQVKVK
jgi:hypothetical protein